MARLKKNQIASLGIPTFTVASSGGDYTDIQSALDAIPAGGGTIEVADGTYTITSTLLMKVSRTTLNFSDGAIVQCDGASVTPLIKPNVTALQGLRVSGGKWLQTNATAQGTCLDFSDAADCLISPTRLENFGLGLNLTDTANTTFYNHYFNIQMFDCNNGIVMGGNPVNDNTFTAIRIRPKAGGAGTGISISNGRYNTFIGVNVEPATGTGITGINLGVSAHYNTFVGVYLENNATNLTINSNANRNSFFGGNMSAPVTTNISDSSSTTGYWNVNDNGAVRNNPAALSSTLTANDINLTTGAALRTRTSAGNTAKLTAFDVDAGTYTTFLTLTANNTPTMDIDDAATKAGQYIYRAGGTDIPLTDGGTGASDASTARTNLGLGSISTQASSNVTVTGGSVTGITDLAVADGGTGASTASAARANLGVVNLVSKGIWSSGTSYVAGDWVTNGGSAWVSLTSNSAVTPVEGVNWTRLASDGLTTNRIIHGPVYVPSGNVAVSDATFTNITNLVAVPNTTSPIEIVFEGDIRITTLTGWTAATLVPVVRLVSDLYRSVTDGARTSGSTTITSATANFTSADVGEPITNAGIPVGTVISSVTNSTTAVISQAATGTASSQTLFIGVVEQFAPRVYMPTWVSNTNPAFEFPTTYTWRLTPSSSSRTYILQAHGGNVNGTITFVGSSTAAGLGARLLTRLP